MLRNRSVLLETAKAKVNESYLFKKGKSRSKKYNSDTSTMAKRKKSNHSARLERMKALEEDIKGIDDRLSYKEKRRKAAEDVKNYRMCEEITEEMTSLMQEKRVLSDKFKILDKKEKQSKLYFKKKGSTSSTSSPPSSRSSTPCPTSDRECASDNVSGNTESDKEEIHF